MSEIDMAMVAITLAFVLAILSGLAIGLCWGKTGQNVAGASEQLDGAHSKRKRADEYAETR